MPNIVPIVEGKADVEALPVLLRRILEMDAGFSGIGVARPIRVPRSKIVRPNELERSLEQATRDRADVGAMLVLLDADDDPPCTLAPQLETRARTATHFPVAIVLANREFESWFLGSKESLRGCRGIRQDAAIPPNHETIRGAKERISQNMEGGRRYVEVDDQPALAAQMDIDTARRNCPSFDKLVREVERLVKEIRASSSFSN